MSKPTISASELRARLSYDALTGVFTWLVGRLFGSQAGTVSRMGYLLITIDRRHYMAHRLAVLYVTGEMPAADVDHRNGVRTDNRWANLRQVSRSNNNENVGGARKNNKSGLLGVSCKGDGRYWFARIQVAGKNRHLGMFDSPAEAHEAYLRAKAELHSHSERIPKVNELRMKGPNA